MMRRLNSQPSSVPSAHPCYSSRPSQRSSRLDVDNDDEGASAPCTPAEPGNQERSIQTPPPRLFSSPLCSTRLAAGANGFPLETWPPQRYAHGLQPVKTDAQRPHPRCDDSFLRPRHDSDQLVDVAPVVRHKWQQCSRRHQGPVLELWCHPICCSGVKVSTTNSTATPVDFTTSWYVLALEGPLRRILTLHLA